MLDEPRNKLDEIADDLQEILSKVILQASVRRSLDKKLAQGAPRKDKRCYAEDDEVPFHDDGDTFELARVIGRIEGRFLKLMDNRLFEYDEDELQGYTHEQLFQKIQAVYEDVREIMSEFEGL